MLLTIAIPTYNRNTTIHANLSLLLPQLAALLPDRCCVRIFDNCSEEPVEETLQPLLQRFDAVNVKITRNAANIGANANIMRCIETCATDWVWVLGDDDPMRPDAIATILQQIEENPDAVVLNFSYDGTRKASFQTRGLEEMAQKLDRSADLPWLSSSVYNARAVRPNLKLGYQHTYALLPHLALLLGTVGADGLCCFSKTPILEERNRDIAPDQQWSLLNLALGFPTLLDMPLQPHVRKLLSDKLLLTNHGVGIQLRYIMYQLLLTAFKEGDARNALYFYDQICARAFYFASPATKAKLRAFRFVLRHPHLARRAFRLLRGRDIGDANFQDRYERA